MISVKTGPDTAFDSLLSWMISGAISIKFMPVSYTHLPRCVWNLLKQHVSRYTPDVVENICGTPKDAFLKVCEYIAETSAHDKTASFLYALGWTQHSIGAQNIRTMAMIQLLLGNMGMAGGGVNALRGHSNIQRCV